MFVGDHLATERHGWKNCLEICGVKEKSLNATE